MKHVKKIIGQDLYLSPVIESDYYLLYEWMNDNNITDNIGRSDKITTYISNEKWFENALESGKYIFSIINNEDELIGCCGINDINFLHQTCEIYIYIGDSKNRGKGLGKKALDLLLNYAFNTLNMNSIFIKAFSFNEHAIALYKKLGFKEIGIRRKNYYLNNCYYDTVFLDLIKEEYLRMSGRSQ